MEAKTCKSRAIVYGATDDPSPVAQEKCGMETFQRIYDQQHRTIFRYVAQRVSDDGDREDIVQSTFIALYDYLSDDKPIKNEAGLLMAIARYKIIDYYVERRKNRQTLLEIQACSKPAGSDQPGEANLKSQSFWDALAQLLAAADYHIVVAMAMGLSPHQIADELECTVINVYWRFHDRILPAMIYLRPDFAAIYCITPHQITNPHNLLGRLRQAQDPLSRYVVSCFPQALQERIRITHAVNPELLKLIIDQLNRLIQDQDIYTPQRFQGVQLAERTRQLLDKADRRIERNRRLLQDAYPEIRRMRINLDLNGGEANGHIPMPEGGIG